jgi:hypothetical protein
MTLKPEHQQLGEGWCRTCERITHEHPDPDVRQLAELLLLLISFDAPPPEGVGQFPSPQKICEKSLKRG